MKYQKHFTCVAVVTALSLAACQAHAPAASDGVDAPRQWVGSWMSAQQVPEPRNALPAADLHDATLRQVIRASLGGERLRLRLSNVYGTAPLTVNSISVARPTAAGTSGIDPRTAKAVTFSKRRRVTIPAGAFMVSDAVEFPVEPLDHVAVSLHLPSTPERQTGHPGSRATSYVLSGNHVTRRSMDDAIQVQHWYQLAGLDVQAHESARAVVVLGDSITDGFGVLPDTDRRWTDFLIARVHQEPELECTLAVLNAGLGGNRLLLDELGPNGMARFERDVIARPGVQHVIVVLGANDLGVLSRDETADQRDHDRLVEEMVAAYEQMAARAREHGIQAIGGTIMPFRGSTFYPAHDMAEASRQKINAWIRSPGNFDAVIDFDALMRASDDPSRMNPGLDSGDHLHPSIAGYEAMANFVALDLFSDADRGSAIPRCPPAVRRTSSSP